MNQSKVTIAVNAFFGKIMSIIGYAVGTFFLLGLFITISEINVEPTDEVVSGFVVCAFFLAISAVLIIFGRRIKKKIQRFKVYVSLISIEHMTSLDDLAHNTSKSVDFVRKDLQKMIDSRFFTNAYIDVKANRIIIGNFVFKANYSNNVSQATDTAVEQVKCSGCGAMNVKQGSNSCCEYCGTLLK